MHLEHNFTTFAFSNEPCFLSNCSLRFLPVLNFETLYTKASQRQENELMNTCRRLLGFYRIAGFKKNGQF